MVYDCQLFFQALSDKSRQKILKLLRQKPLCVSEICQHFKMTQPSISHHLDILKRAKLVKTEKKGKEVFYSLNCFCMEACCEDFFKDFNICLIMKRK